MKKNWKYAALIILGITAILLTSCVTPGAVLAETREELPTIQERYSDRFEATHVGMSTAEFRSVWPDARIMSESRGLIVYEFRDVQTYYTSHDRRIGVLWTGTVRTQEYAQRAQFFFVDDALDRYEVFAE